MRLQLRRALKAFSYCDSHTFIFFLIDQAHWEVKMFVKRRKSDGRTPEHGYTISFSAQADLKRLFNACIFFSFKDVVSDAECIRYC